MTIRDFFILLIKIFGLFMLLSTVFSTLPGVLPYLSISPFWKIIASTLAMLALMIGLYYLLIKKAGWLVDVLQLTKGFDEDRIALGNPNKLRVIQLAILLIGGTLWVIHVPSIIFRLLAVFQQTVNQYQFNPSNAGGSLTQLATNMIAILIGYLLFTNSQRLAQWLIRQETP